VPTISGHRPALNTSTSMVNIKRRCDAILRELRNLKFLNFQKEDSHIFPFFLTFHASLENCTRSSSNCTRCTRLIFLTKMYPPGTPMYPLTSLGYVKKLSKEEANQLRGRHHWFLPHFIVFHPDKPDRPRQVKIFPDVHQAVFASACPSQHLKSQRQERHRVKLN
jgi:hypothetical protein